MDIQSETLLAGRKGLVVGIANEHSIAYGCARIFRRCGAELAVTWLNDKARPHVDALARQLEAHIAMPLDVEQPGATEAVFDAVRERWGRLDFVLHSIAFAPAAGLYGRGAGRPAQGFGGARALGRPRLRAAPRRVRARGRSARPGRRQLARGLRARDGHLVPFVRAHG